VSYATQFHLNARLNFAFISFTTAKQMTRKKSPASIASLPKRRTTITRLTFSTSARSFKPCFRTWSM